MSTNRRKLRLNTFTVDLGCSSRSCRRPKLSSFFHPRPKHKAKAPTYYQNPKHNHNHYHSSSNSWDTSHTTTTTTTTIFSPYTDTPTTYYCSDPETDVKSSRAVQGFGRIGGESVAVEKDSEDPYLDFRQSMLQMILEKQIYSKDDLRELLNCFLQLNAPYYHGIIVRAFTEIWNGVYSVRSPPKLHAGGGSRRSRAF